jgi:hypothetical protein
MSVAASGDVEKTASSKCHIQFCDGHPCPCKRSRQHASAAMRDIRFAQYQILWAAFQVHTIGVQQHA